MRFKFFSHLIVMLVINLMVKPVAIFVIDAGVQNRVGSTAYGGYFALLSFTYLFNILLDMGLSNFNTKRIARQPQNIKESLASLLPLRLGLFLVYLFVSLLLSWTLNFSHLNFELLLLLIINQFLVMSTLFFRSYFNGLLLFRTEILFSVLDKLLLVIAGTWWLYGSGLPVTVFGFVILQTGTYLITFLLALWLVVKRTGWVWKTSSYSHYTKVLKASIPYALLIVFMMIYQRADAVWLERLAKNHAHEAGLYAQGYRILDALFMFAGMFSGLLFPLFAHMLRKKESVNDLFESSGRVLFSGAIIIAGAGIFFPGYILNLFYTETTRASEQMFSLLMVAFIPMCVIVLYGTLLTAKSELKILNRLSFAGIIVNSALNYVLIPEYGGTGAAIACLSTQTVVAVGQMIYIFSKSEIKFRFSENIRFMGLLLLLMGMGYLANLVTWSTSIQLLSFISVAIIYMLVSHLLPWKFVVSLLKK